LQVRDLLDDPQECSRAPYSGGRRLRKSSDVYLVNDGVFHGAVERTVTFPVVAGAIDDDRTHGSGQVIVRSAGGSTFPKGVGIAAGVGINQHLLFVEPVTGGRIPRAIHAKRVVCTGLQPVYKYVPEVEALVDGWIELHYLEGLRRVMRREQEQFHPGGICRKEGEIDASLPRTRAQRMRRTPLNRKRGMRSDTSRHTLS